MIFAARKLQGIGLIMLVTFCFLIAYPISLKVSATRAELQRVEREIAATQARNRMLEGDIAVLANIRQLDRWNHENFGYVAPGAAQYLSGERALATLDRLRPARDGAAPAPVIVAASAADNVDRADDDAAPVRTAASHSRAAADRLALLDRARVTHSALADIARTMPLSATTSVAPALTPAVLRATLPNRALPAHPNRKP